ncbi:hypothetical protein BDZ89DRAFT_1111610 [Hymenopellis radicata]|nr:hypothetical protein BDZ89DRAFT_1111610 [Hymenopellis radicata]
MAVLVKQWIHQYMTVPSGTPCDRSRIRQFSTSGAVLVGVIGFVAFVAYFGTTLLPLFKPDCPYKTYLTLYSYSISAYLCMSARRSHLRVWIRSHVHAIRRYFVSQPAVAQDKAASNGPSAATWLRSLRDVEKQTVASIAEALDARALVGLYNISSNTSVQRIVLQALSAVPLDLLSVVKLGIPDVAERIRSLVESMEFTSPDKQTAYERLYRAHVRVEPAVPKFVPPNVLTPALDRVIRLPNALALLVDYRHPEHAIWFVRKQIARSNSYQEFDVFMWARILQNALSFGVDWLDIGDNTSPVWSEFIWWIIQTHGCLTQTSCSKSSVELLSLPLFIDDEDEEDFGKLDSKTFRLRVRTYPRYPTTRPVELRCTMTMLMRPCIAEYFFHVLFPNYCRGDEYKGLPYDIRLNLALIQSPHVLSTSRSGDTIDDQDEDEEQPTFSPGRLIVPVQHRTPVAKLLYVIREYVAVIDDICNVPGGTLGQHPSVIKATFHTLKGLVNSESFSNDTLAQLVQREWLAEFHETLMASRVRRGIDIRIFKFYSFLASLQTMDYLKRSDNLVILCKMLVLSDDNRRGALKQLYLLFPDHWSSCMAEVEGYFHSEEGRSCYTLYRKRFYQTELPSYDGRFVEVIEYCPLEDLLMQVSNWASGNADFDTVPVGGLQ